MEYVYDRSDGGIAKLVSHDSSEMHFRRSRSGPKRTRGLGFGGRKKTPPLFLFWCVVVVCVFRWVEARRVVRGKGGRGEEGGA